MKFVRVINDEMQFQPREQHNRKALFHHEGMFFVYSYVKNEMAHETMVFPWTGGDSFESREITSDRGYVPSTIMMKRVVDIFDNDAKINENTPEVDSC
jgi:hypothetical protein